MKFGTKWMVLLAVFFTATFALAGGEKKNANISFHIETEATDNPKMIFPYEVMGRQRFFRRIPEVSSKDLVAFTPFPAEDQASYGVIFQLKNSAARRLAAVTSISQGKWFVCQAFGRIVDGVLVDEPINDGAVVIWKGLTLEEIREIDKTIPRIGEKKKRG
ncbi:hypothetical protein ACFSSA_10350 [Luteolibacter algae]|uniref:Uncharacterized protein n=1 Tax=Luteolibacter algae TaxID=454151 RepID=A0ABW5D9E9_9BACT